MEEVPEEILLRIFGYLTASELGRCTEVSRTWLSVGRDDSLWKRLFRRDFKETLVNRSARQGRKKSERKRMAKTRNLVQNSEVSWWEKYRLSYTGTYGSDQARMMELSLATARDRLLHSMAPRKPSQTSCPHPTESVAISIPYPKALGRARNFLKLSCSSCDLLIQTSDRFEFEQEVRDRRKAELEQLRHATSSAPTKR